MINLCEIEGEDQLRDGLQPRTAGTGSREEFR